MTEISLSGYTLVKKIGEGAMSEVFLGTCSSGKFYAIKILKQYLKKDSTYVERLEKEAAHLSKFDDERIVRFIEAKTTQDDRLAIIQEYVDGEDLLNLIERHTNISMPVIGAVLISEILLGLEEAHRSGIIHRDLKPANIMITKSGKVKITDFGISKNLESETLTLTGAFLGSPAYMAPEQAQSNHIDERTDIFGLGVVLYQLATTEFPFKGSNYPTLIKAIIDGKYTPPEVINPKIHPDLAKVIKKAIQNDITKRYQKVYQFRSDLLLYLDHIKAPSPYKVLKAFYLGDLSFEKQTENNLVETIIKKANTALENGERKQGFIYLQQVLAIEPDNSKAQTLITSTIKHRNKNKRLPLLIVLLIIVSAFASGSYFLKQNNISPQAPNKTIIKSNITNENLPRPKAITKKEVPKPVIIQKKRPKKNIIKVPPKNPSGITFNVDPDVSVYLDNLLIPPHQLIKYITPPGTYKLTLHKKGFNPINGKVKVIEGEFTVINAKR